MTITAFSMTFPVNLELHMSLDSRFYGRNSQILRNVGIWVCYVKTNSELDYVVFSRSDKKSMQYITKLSMCIHSGFSSKSKWLIKRRVGFAAQIIMGGSLNPLNCSLMYFQPCFPMKLAILLACVIKESHRSSWMPKHN